MANAKLDQNSRPTLTALSSVDGVTIVNCWADPTTHRLLVDLPASSGITSINADTTAAQLITVGTAGTDVAVSNAVAGTTTINIPTASASNRGALSTTDWTTFNNKLGSLSGAVLTTTNQSVAGIKTFSDATEATNTTTGGTVVSGGLAVAKRVYALDMTVTNAITGGVTGNAGTVTNGVYSTYLTANNAIAASGNAATVPITSRVNTVTNNSAATLTITMARASAYDGQMTLVRILDASAAAQTITWVNTENSTVTAPVTSNGSTTLPLTVGFQYNGGTSKWRCIASA
jgi:hypothetical protein